MMIVDTLDGIKKRKNKEKRNRINYQRSEKGNLFNLLCVFEEE